MITMFSHAGSSSISSSDVQSCSIVRTNSSSSMQVLPSSSSVIDAQEREEGLKRVVRSSSSSDMSDITCLVAIGSAVRSVADKSSSTIKVKRREASPRTKRIASVVAAVTTSLIFTWAIRSCIPADVTAWHKQAQNAAHLRSSPESRIARKTYVKDDFILESERADHRVLNETSASQQQEQSDEGENENANELIPSTKPDHNHRRLTHMEYAHQAAPSDLKKMHHNYPRQQYGAPQTTEHRNAMPLSEGEYKLNPLIKPDGYPWHRWAKPADGSYPLNTQKYVNIFSQLGTGQDTLGTVTPNNYTVGGVALTPDVIRLGPHVRPYIIKDGTVLRPQGRTGMFVTLVQRAIEMAASLADESPRMKILSEGEIPLIFDANDYPWCGDDLVPIFRLNAIQSSSCKHSWPAMSLTYFQDPTNVQLAESPYQWDEMMATYDETYPWDSKMPKMVWRGRITGYTYPDGERPRQELVRYARNFLDIMDVKPSTQRSKIPQDDFMKYKAILDIDGNAWSARLGKLLCFNSVVIKVEPEFVGYWEKEIEPWVHYIPVESDFSDLEKTVRYVMDPKNSEQMQQIVKNGQQFCRTKLTMEQYTVDILWTLLSYAELLENSPDFYSTWRSDSSAYRMPGQKMGEWKPRVTAAARS